MQLFGLQMRSTLLPGQPWDVMVDLFFYREPEETKDPSEEEAADYGGDAQPYGQLPAPGGELTSTSATICYLLLSSKRHLGRLCPAQFPHCSLSPA